MNWFELIKKVKKLDPHLYTNDDCFAIHITDTIIVWCWIDKELRLTSEGLGNYVRIKIKKMNSYDDVYKLCKILTAKEKNNEQNKNN